MGVACKILINRPSGLVHRPGEEVTGVVHFAIDEPTEYSEATVSLVGKGNCSWIEAKSLVNDEILLETQTYRGEECYVKKISHILCKSFSRTTLLIGSYQCPFKFRLPEAIPSSFSTRNCDISYKIIVYFRKTGFFRFNRVFEVPIRVYGFIDQPTPDLARTFELNKVLFKPFSEGKQEIKLTVEIEQACLSPGQTAKLSFVLTNDTDVDVILIKSDLIMLVAYHADCGRMKESSGKVDGCTMVTAGVSSRSVVKLNSILPILRELYSVQYSKVVSVKYELQVTLRLPMPHVDASVRVPLVIGDMKPEVAIDALKYGNEVNLYKNVIAG